MSNACLNGDSCGRSRRPPCFRRRSVKPPPRPGSSKGLRQRVDRPVRSLVAGEDRRARQLRQHIHANCRPFALEALDFPEAESCVKMQ
jgi:hypothetical protein